MYTDFNSISFISVLHTRYANKYYLLTFTYLLSRSNGTDGRTDRHKPMHNNEPHIVRGPHYKFTSHRRTSALVYAASYHISKLVVPSVYSVRATDYRLYRRYTRIMLYGTTRRLIRHNQLRMYRYTQWLLGLRA